MAFYIVSLNFVRQAVVLINDSPKTKSFDQKDCIMMVVGEEKVRGEDHVCGFMMTVVGGKRFMPVSAFHLIEKEYEDLKNLGVDERIKRIKQIYPMSDIKIKKEFIVDQTRGPGDGPIKMFGKHRIWSEYD